MQVNILASPRLRNKLCSRINKTFRCKEVFGCQVACPFRIAELTQQGMGEKNLPLGEAYRLSLRQGIDKEEGRAIIRDAILKKHEEYPDKSYDEIYKDTLDGACKVCKALLRYRRTYEQKENNERKR